MPALPLRWTVRRSRAGPRDLAQAQSDHLRNVLRVPRVLCDLLVLRGFGAEDDARSFLKPRLERLHDPYAMAGMDGAVDRLDRALRAGETILAHGDYDVDGICGATLLTRVLRGMGADVRTFVPHRLTDGYDLSAAGVRAAAAAGATLIVTADCGTVAHDAIAAAADAGIDVVVTDHHTPGPTLPDAVAVVNPNRADCTYADKSLAGAGVAFKLCHALAARRGMDPRALWYYLDLVAVATIADLAPLTGENRVFTRFGLQLLRQTRNPGLAALLRTANIDGALPLGAGQVSHGLAPRINAVGRMGDAKRGVRLLLAEHEDEAQALAEEMERENDTRRAVDRDTLAQALAMLEHDYEPDRDYGIVLASAEWHPGVIGIVASRVVERLHRPTILIAIDAATGRARGSARSIPGFHLYEAIRDCAHLLERYGGHRQAAGLDIRVGRIAELRDAFNQQARARLAPDDLQPRLHIDLEVHLSEATPRLLLLLRHLGPFGIGNPAPVFAARNVGLARPLRVVGSGHARLVLEQDGSRLHAIAFGMAERIAGLDPAKNRLDVVFQLQENRYNDRLQAKIVDVRISR